MLKAHIKKIQDLKSFKKLDTQWNNLLAISPIKSAFLSWEWLYSWWNVYGDDRKLWIVSVWKDEKLVGLAPLMLETRKKSGAMLKFLVNMGTPQSDAGGFLFDPSIEGVADKLVTYILQHKSEWDIAELNVLHYDGKEREALTRLAGPEKFYIKEEINDHYYVGLDTDWEIYNKRLSKKFLHNLRRASRLADEMGLVEIRHYTGSSVKPELIQELIKINRQSHYPRLYRSKEEQGLLFELIRNGGENHNWLDIYILHINNEAIAYEYGFVHEGRFESWRAGFNTSMPQNISVGKLLSMKVIQKCIQEGYQEIDFLRGDEAYKLEWKPDQKKYSNLRLFNKGKLSAILSYRWLHNVKPIIKEIKGSIRRSKQ